MQQNQRLPGLKHPLRCSPLSSSSQLAAIREDSWLSERGEDLPRLHELRHFQAHTGHWLEGLSSQSAVYQRSGTGNQFSNAVSACSPQPWSTPRRADVDGKDHVRGHVRLWPVSARPIYQARQPTKGQTTPQNMNLPSEALIEHWMHLMALSKWVQLSWERLWFLITDQRWILLTAKSDQRRTRRKHG